MAQIQSKVLDMSSVFTPLQPFIQSLLEEQKANRERLISYGSMLDFINRVNPDSKVYKEYYSVMNDLLDYSGDIAKGSHVPGVNATKANNLFMNYGKVTGRITRLLKQIEESETRRFNAENTHPNGIIFYDNNPYKNIDALVNGKEINNNFIDRKGVMDMVSLLFANLGASLDKDPKYRRLIEETGGYQTEVIQRGGLAALAIDDILETGTTNKLDKPTIDAINNHINRLKQVYNYDAMDEIAKNQFKNLIKSGVVFAASDVKVNFITSGQEEEQAYSINKDRVGIARANSQNRRKKGSTPTTTPQPVFENPLETYTVVNSPDEGEQTTSDTSTGGHGAALNNEKQKKKKK